MNYGKGHTKEDLVKKSPQQNQLNPPLTFHSGTCFLHNMAFLSMKYVYKSETLLRSLLSPLEASWSLGVGWQAGWKVQLGAGCWAQLGKGGHWVEAQVEKSPPQQIPRQPLPRNAS